jgi:hypothetical protein
MPEETRRESTSSTAEVSSPLTSKSVPKDKNQTTKEEEGSKAQTVERRRGRSSKPLHMTEIFRREKSPVYT